MGEGPEISISSLGAVQWPLCLCLLLAWILIAVFVSNGIRSTGKVSTDAVRLLYRKSEIGVIMGEWGSVLPMGRGAGERNFAEFP